MELQEFTSQTGQDGTKIVRVAGRISNHQDRDEQSEWIEFQFSIDVPTVRNGALLRAEALKKASAILQELGTRFERLGYAP